MELQAAPSPFRRAGMPPAVITEALDAGARDALAEAGLRVTVNSDDPPIVRDDAGE